MAQPWSHFRRLWGDSSLLPTVSRLGLIVLDEGETLEIDSEDMESAFNLFRMPSVRKSFSLYRKKSLAQCTPVVTPTNGFMWPSQVGAVDLIQRIARALSRPAFPTAWFAWMAWMWLLRQTLQPTVRPRLPTAFVLHVIASRFRSTLGNGWSGRPLHPSSVVELLIAVLLVP